MKWTYRRYRLWVINTPTEANLYLWDKWNLLMPAINKLVNITKEEAFIRSFQSYEQENSWLGFGRMPWNEDNNIKWTTKYRNIASEDKILNFFSTEVWAPDWNKVSKENIPPDIFIKLYNYSNAQTVKEGFVIAMPKAMYKKNKTLVDVEITKLVNHIPNASLNTLTRLWQPVWKFSNRIENINFHEIQEIIKQKN
ncbi:MAG: hypothetical protein V4538_09040 [Bacteroidota bacterium]